MSDAWFEEGYSSPAPKRESTFEPFRFVIKKADIGKNFIVTFLDDRPFRFFEHQFTFEDGTFNNFAVCTRSLGEEFSPCPACQIIDAIRRKRKMTRDDPKRYYVGMLTVVDETGDGKGNYTNRRRLFPLKEGSLDKAKQHLRKRGGGLIGCRYVLSRTGEKTATVGDDWEPCEDVPRIPGTGPIAKWAKTNVYPLLDVLERDPNAPLVLPTPPADMLEQAYTAVAAHYQPKNRDGEQYATMPPFDYKKIFRPMPRDEFVAWLRAGGLGKDIASASGGAADNARPNEFEEVEEGRVDYA